MVTLSLVHWLLLGNIAMLFVVGGFMWSLRRQQQLDTQRFEQHISALEQSSGAMSKSTIGIGRRVKQLETRLQQAERHAVMPGSEDARFEQASRLVGMGATANDLVDNCGVARGEAELLVSLRRQVQ